MPSLVFSNSDCYQFIFVDLPTSCGPTQLPLQFGELPRYTSQCICVPLVRNNVLPSKTTDLWIWSAEASFDQFTTEIDPTSVTMASATLSSLLPPSKLVKQSFSGLSCLEKFPNFAGVLWLGVGVAGQARSWQGASAQCRNLLVLWSCFVCALCSCNTDTYGPPTPLL